MSKNGKNKMNARGKRNLLILDYKAPSSDKNKHLGLLKASTKIKVSQSALGVIKDKKLEKGEREELQRRVASLWRRREGNMA